VRRGWHRGFGRPCRLGFCGSALDSPLLSLVPASHRWFIRSRYDGHGHVFRIIWGLFHGSWRIKKARLKTECSQTSFQWKFPTRL
jgi:hypothetical protein